MNTVDIKLKNNAPKIGQIYEDKLTRKVYILAEVTQDQYALISLYDGSRFVNAVSNIDDVFNGKDHIFGLLDKDSSITLTVK